MSVTEPTVYTRAFHAVFNEVDTHDSAAAVTDLLCMFVAFLRPKVVVEAGTYRGRSALAIANILRLNEQGVLYTADPVNRVAESLAHPDLATILPHIRYHEGDFLEMLATITEPVDLAYLDASHKDNPHMRRDHCEALASKLSPGALVFVDDTEGDWEDARLFRLQGRHEGLHLPQHRGLTIIQRKV